MGVVDIVGGHVDPAAGGQAVGHAVHPVVALALHHCGNLLIGVGVGADGHAVVHLADAHMHVGGLHSKALHIAHHLAVHVLPVVGHPGEVIVVPVHDFRHSYASFLFS